MYSTMGLNTQELKSSYDFVRTLGTMSDNVYFTVDYQQRIVAHLRPGNDWEIERKSSDEAKSLDS